MGRSSKDEKRKGSAGASPGAAPSNATDHPTPVPGVATASASARDGASEAVRSATSSAPPGLASRPPTTPRGANELHLTRLDRDGGLTQEHRIVGTIESARMWAFEHGGSLEFFWWDPTANDLELFSIDAATAFEIPPILHLYLNTSNVWCMVEIF